MRGGCETSQLLQSSLCGTNAGHKFNNGLYFPCNYIAYQKSWKGPSLLHGPQKMLPSPNSSSGQWWIWVSSLKQQSSS